MDKDLQAHLEAMEARLMRRINGNQEIILNELGELHAAIRNLRSEHEVTRKMVTELPATVLGAIEQPLLRRMTAAERRLDKLEKPPEGS